MVHALSFDIEDWFHIVDIPALEDTTKWDSYSSIVEYRTNSILDLLEKHNTKATFFVLGWIANKYPDLVKSISDAGHEIGTHSYWHRRVYELSPDEFRKDLDESISLLESISGKRVLGFRAPSFSIIPGIEWAFDILKDSGLEYDASLFPATRGHGGYECEQEIHRLKTHKDTLIELPMSIYKKFGFKMPFSGGGYFRLLSYPFIRAAFKSFEKTTTPVVVYLHPRDFAPETPVVKMPLHRKFKSYYGLEHTYKKLDNLLSEFEFSTCFDVIQSKKDIF